MIDLNLNKLNVNIESPHTSTDFVRFRRYSLTNDDCGNLYLTIDTKYENDIDGVYGQWAWISGDDYVLTLFVIVGNDEYDIAKKRYDMFKSELPLAVSAIVNGDKEFLNSHTPLLKAHISMRFISAHADFNKTVFYCHVNTLLKP